MENLSETLVPIAVFAMIVLIVYFIGKFRYQTNKAILEKGGNIELSKKKFPLIEIGLTVIGIGVGLGLSVFAQASNLTEDTKGLLIGACITFFGGLGLVSAYLIRKKIEKEQ